jgi:small-conductance mechanosensitive channel
MLLELAQPLAILGIALAALIIIRHLLLRSLRRRLPIRASYAKIFLDTIGLPSVLWCLAGALAIALRFSTLNDREMQLAGVCIAIFLIVSLSLVLASAAVQAITLYGQRQGIPMAVAGLSRTLVYLFVLSLGLLSLMGYLGVEVRPFIAALGIGGLAVALALQDTLANFFAGVHILVETPINVGDFIQLSTGEEGTVTDIGWRTTRVQTGANNVIVIPNTKITSSILTNFSLPDHEVVAEVVVAADHTADTDRILRIAPQVCAATEGVLEAPPPVLLFDPGVLPTHLQFKLLFHVSSQQQKGPVQSRVRLGVLEAFRREGVPLPRGKDAPPPGVPQPAARA